MITHIHTFLSVILPIRAGADARKKPKDNKLCTARCITLILLLFK
nr:MAG TPA: hypothetical protein [Caudoviricetes sp.]